MVIRDEIRRDMESRDIDVELSLSLLERINSGPSQAEQSVQADRIPEVDGERVVDTTSELSFTGDARELAARLADLDISGEAVGMELPASGSVTLTPDLLHALGMSMIPQVAYGVLNGGSATSYADRTKNESLNKALFRLYEPLLETVGEQVRGKAKGLTPALFDKDGTPGASFLELKMRHLLLLISESIRRTGRRLPADHAPMFQMTSVHNDEEVARAYRTYRTSSLLQGLINDTGVDITQVRTGVQPMICAYTHSDEGMPRGVFSSAFGETDRTLPLPGGHGQSFGVLKSVFREMRSIGFRFAYMGNVDNLGYTVDPASLAYFALSGRPAAFEFSYKTPVDVKGGVLVEDSSHRFNCGDIGPAVSKSYIEETERAGTPILFNCATGLFDLEWLVSRIEQIEADLPLRVSDQDKDAGRYSQAEQVTWEVIGMIDRPLIFAVDKYKRFLAAKLLSESFMTNGIGLDDPRFPVDDRPEYDLKATAQNLNSGLQSLLRDVYRWPISGSA
ncbi:MAG: UTP--glucose-1-phosphate uridylyltransferase [Spirochaetaceae bacterium]